MDSRERLRRRLGALRKKRTILLGLSAIAVFITAYALILPATTLDKDTARQQGGIDVTQTTDQAQAGQPVKAAQEEAAEEEAPAESAQEDVADQESADRESADQEAADEDVAVSAEADAEPAGEESAAEEPEQKAAGPVCLQADGDGYSVSVMYDADAGLPENTELTATEILPEDENYDSLRDKALAALRKQDGKSKAGDLKFSRFFDISLSADGKELEPAAPVDVNISYDRALSVEDTDCVRVIHFAENEKSGETEEQVLDPGDVEAEVEKNRMTGTAFETEGFSVFGVVYTVDFQYDGTGLAFTLKGGDSVSFAKLAQVLGIPESYGKNGSGAASGEKASEAGEQQDASGTDTDEVTKEEIEISGATKEFLKKVKDVKFSDPDLLWIEKIEKDTDPEGILFKHDLTPEYPAGTTANEYGEFASRKFTAPDWALISLKPFSSEEALTITMESGEEIVIQVTDDADAVLIDDPNGNGKIVQTITNPSGTTIDLFDYWITDSLRYSAGMDGWPGHRGNAFDSYQFDWYNYNGNYEGNNQYTYLSQDSNGDYYVQNNHLRGNGNNQGINTNHVFKFYPGAAGTVVDYGDKGNNHRRGTNNAWTNNHDKYTSINSWTGDADPTTGLVQKTLNADGYPQLTNTYSLGTDGSSLSYLFDGTNRSGKQKYGDVDHLLYVDSDGYYTYDSRYYSAAYNGGKFTLREHSSGATQSQRGFWPFGDRVNWHGMHMTTNFSMPANGKVLNPKGEYKDMEFQFSGDDDTWLYIDGVLVGDGGGIHNRTEIDINFATGLVTVKGTNDPNHQGTYVWTKYLDEIYRDAGKYNDYEWDGHTFRSGSYHQFEMFYLERGGSESNLYIHYNLVSTTDFSAHKSYHSEDDSRLERDQFQFELIGFDNTAYTNGFVQAIMPDSGTASGEGTVASPRKVHKNTAPEGLELPSNLTAHTSLLVGVTEDGNVNFGNIQVQESQKDMEYKYVVREVVPADAVNADQIRWDEASAEVKAEGGFVKDGITYDGRVYYFVGKVQETEPGSGLYELRKTRYIDATYSTVDTETKFFSFVNGYVKPITLKVIKKSDSGKLLSGAEFSLTRAMKNEENKWVVRQYQHNGETVSSTPRTGTTNAGTLNFDNLTEGHYILEETAAPSGYTKNETYRWLLALQKQDAADKIVLVPTLQALDENGALTGEEKELTPDAGNVIEHEVLNGRIPRGDIKVEKKWLKIDGTSVYTDAELEELGVNGTRVTGELWRTGHASGAADSPTVTIFAKLDNQSDYQQKWQGQVASGSDISYSMAVNGTGHPMSTTTSTGGQPVASPDQNITYDNGINKPSGHVYTLKNVTQDVQIYAVFDHAKANSTGIGFYLVSRVEPAAAPAADPEAEHFDDFTLQAGSWSKTWSAAELYGSDLDEDWVYEFRNVTESPALDDFEFTEEPQVAAEGTTTTYTYRNICRNVSVKILKVIEDTETPLAGAEFTLTQVDSEKHVVKDENDQPVAQVKTTADTTGELIFENLAPGGWYMLEETGVPAGFIREEGPYYIHIGEDGSGSLDTTVAHTMISPESGNTYTVKNTPGVELPSAGGHGTIWIYLLGSVLLIGCGTALAVRRRLSC